MTYTIPLPETKITQQSRQRIGEAIYLLAHLIRSVNWETGKACITQESIADETGFPSRTIARWLATLVDAGEITTRRVKHGTLVQITDYEAIARTRGFKHRPPPESDKPRKPAGADMPETACDRVGNMPRMADESATSGEQSMPRAADDHARYGERSIVQILPQVMGPNMFPNAPSPSGDPRKAPGRDQTDSDRSPQPPPVFRDLSGAERNGNPETSRVLTADELRQKLARLGEEEYRIVEKRAMEDLERDPRPFWRAFVVRNEEGELEANTPAGKHMVMRRMADILDRSVSSDALTSDQA